MTELPTAMPDRAAIPPSSASVMVTGPSDGDHTGGSGSGWPGSGGRLARLMPVSVLLLPFFVLLLPPLLQHQIFFHEDLEYYFYPLRGWLRHFWREQHLVGWNPWTGAGIPLLADLQLAPFYPLSLLFYLLPTGLAFNISFLLHFVLGSGLSYGFFRSLGRSAPAATLGTLIFVWSGFFWAHLHHVTFLAAGVWLPGMLWAWELHRKGQGGLWLLTLCVGMSTLAGGSPQLVYYALVVLGLRIVSSPWQGFEWEAVRRKLEALSVTVLSVLLGSIQLLPFYLATLDKYREPLDRLTYASSFALSPLSLGRMLVPDMFGNDFFGRNGVGFDGPSTYWESWCYLGMVTLPLVAFTLRRGGPDRFYRWLLAGAFLSSLGMFGGVHVLLVYVLPGYASFRAPSRLWLLVGLAAAVLASRALDGLIRAGQPGAGPAGAEGQAREGQAREGQAREELETSGVADDRVVDSAYTPARIRRIARVLLVLGLEVWALCGLSIFARSQPLHTVATRGWAIALILLLSSVLGLRRWATVLEGNGSGGTDPQTSLRRSLRFAWGVVCFLLVDLLLILSTFNQTVPAETATRVPEVVAQLQARIGHERVLTDRSAPLYLLNAGMDFGFRSVRGYNPLNPADLTRFLEISDRSEPREGGISLLVNDVESPLLAALSPRLLVSGKPIEGGRFVEVWRDEAKGVYLGEDPSALPRAFLTGRVVTFPDQTVAMSHARQVWRFVPPEVSVLGEPTEVPPLDASAPQKSSLRWDADEPDFIQLSVTAAGPVLLVLADRLAPGWTAALDGEAVSPLRVWGFMRGVVIPHEGTHRVTFRYQTPGFREGAALSVGALLGLLSLAFWRRRSGGAEG